MKNPYAIYQHNTIESLPPAQITLLLYNKTLQCLDTAQQAFSNSLSVRDHEIIHNNLTRAYNILCELQRSLNFDQAPQLAHALYGTYKYAIQQVLQANQKKVAEPIKHAYRVISEIRDAWQTMLKEQNGKTVK